MKRICRVLFFMLLMLVMAKAAGTQDAKAADTYKIKINKQCCTVTVYKYNGTKYKAHKAFVCSPGYATPVGTFSLGEKMRWHTLDGPTYGQYCTRITGSILFHSVWYYEPEKDTQSYVQYNKLGTLASHGCVRLTVADAKWIYDNVPSGTSVKIYNSSKPGPLGKPQAIKVNGSQGWDPTDPDPANPYLKKNPKIRGVKKTVELKMGESYDPKSGVSAVNTTGYGITSRIKVTFYYRKSSLEDYVETDKLDTTQMGEYKVVYSVTDEIGHSKTRKSIVTIKPSKLVKKIKLKDTEKTLYIGGKESLGTFLLEAKAVKPDTASIKDLKFSSAGTKVATVDEEGNVTAVGVGKVYITVAAVDGSGVSAQCLITVEQLVTKISVTAPSFEMQPGLSMQLKVKVTPSDAADKTVSYTTSDPNVAVVSESGSVTAIAPGTVKIKVKANDPGGKSVTLKITVSGTVETVPVEAVPVVTGSAVTGSYRSHPVQSALSAPYTTKLTINDIYNKKPKAGISQNE